MTDEEINSITELFFGGSYDTLMKIEKMREENEILKDRINKAIKRCEEYEKKMWDWEGAYSELFEEIKLILRGVEQ